MGLDTILQKDPGMLHFREYFGVVGYEYWTIQLRLTHSFLHSASSIMNSFGKKKKERKQMHVNKAEDGHCPVFGRPKSSP
jgi:hypothetical protein